MNIGNTLNDNRSCIFSFGVVEKVANDLVRRFMENKGVKQTVIAEKVHLTQSGLSKLLGSNDMYVSKLFELCEALEHDFFADLSQELRKRNVTGRLEEPSIRYTADLERAVIDIINKHYGRPKK